MALHRLQSRVIVSHFINRIDTDTIATLSKSNTQKPTLTFIYSRSQWQTAHLHPESAPLPSLPALKTHKVGF